MTNPIESVAEWTDGVGHGPESAGLYLALVLEECAELLEAARITLALHESSEAERATISLQKLSHGLRSGQFEANPAGAPMLDAALDTAWVALCLGRALTGERLPQAWAELHRSNVTDKQQGGVFVKDASGKVMKPAHYKPANFAQFLAVVDSEGGETE